MPKLPVISGDDFVRAMEKLGYQMERTRGSHMIIVCTGRPRLSVPRHHELDRGTLRGLIRDSGLTIDDFLTLLRK